MALFRGVGGGGQSSAQASADEVALLVIQAEAARDAALVAQAAAENAEALSDADAAATAASAAAAAASEANAAASAASVAASAAAASTSETNAATSASNAATSESNAATSETNAANSASAASTSETNAASSASAAATSASNAATSQVNAATSASNAATSEINAATSEINAAASAASIAASEAAAAASAAASAASAAAAATFDPNDFIRNDTANESFVSLTGNSVTANTFTGDLVGNADTATTALSADTATAATTAQSANTANSATTAGNANLLDNLNSTQFLRSDASDSFTTLTGNTIDVTNLLVDGAPLESGGYEPPIGSMVFFPDDLTNEVVEGSLKFLKSGVTSTPATYPSGKARTEGFKIGMNSANPINHGVGTALSDFGDIEFSQDGMHLYMSDLIDDRIYHWELATAWDIDTVIRTTFVTVDNVALQETVVTAVAINDDGTRLYTAGSSDDLILQWEVATPYDLSTAYYEGKSLSVGSDEASIKAMTFRSNGTRLYIVGVSGDEVNQYDLSTAWDITTAGSPTTFSVAGQDTTPQGIAFNSTGTRMYITGDAGNDINQYVLFTSWQISSALFSTTFSVSAQETTPEGIAINWSNDRDWILGGTQADAIQKYRMNSVNSINTSVSQGSVPYFGGQGVDFTFGNNGTRFYIQTSNLIRQYNLSTAYDLTTHSGIATTLTLPDSGTHQGVTFNDTGTKMFVLRQSFDTIQQYTLSSAWEISTASKDLNTVLSSPPFGRDIEFAGGGTYLYATNSSVIFKYTLSSPYNITTVTDLESLDQPSGETLSNYFYITDDGKYFFTTGASRNTLVKYRMTTPHDLNTIIEVERRMILGEQAFSYGGIYFKPDGDRMFLGSLVNFSINEYITKPSDAIYVGDPVGRYDFDNETVGYIRVE